jgi:hypothetical protein
MQALDSIEYDRFEFGEDAKPLSLEEATAEAVKMRSRDPESFYRVEIANTGGSGFVVKRVSVSDVYSDFFARIARSMNRYSRRRS